MYASQKKREKKNFLKRKNKKMLPQDGADSYIYFMGLTFTFFFLKEDDIYTVN